MTFLHRCCFLTVSIFSLTGAASLARADAPPRGDDDEYEYEDDDEDQEDRDDRGERDDRDDRDRRRAGVPPEWARDKRGRAKKVLPAEKGEAPPPGYREGKRPILGLVIPGAVLLPVAWLASSLTSLTCAAVQAVPGEGCYVAQAGWGVLPLMGPFVVATANGTDSGWRAGYALYGAFQNASLAMVIIGATVQRDVWVLTPEARRAEERASIFVGPGTVGVHGAF